jgi:hypothetical protein
VDEADDARHEGEGGYGTFPRALWRSERFRKLGADARYVLAFLRSYPADVRSIAMLRTGTEEAEAATVGLNVERWRAAIAELVAAGFIQRDADWIWVVDAFANFYRNPNHHEAARRALVYVPAKLRTAFLRRWPNVRSRR